MHRQQVSSKGPRRWMLTMAAVLVSGCTVGGNSPTPTPTPVNGGTLTLGIWQEPPSLLSGGVTGTLAFAEAAAAPVQEGLLWYRAATDTRTASTEADYWAPDLAIEVPTVANGDVRTTRCPTAQAAMCVTWKLRDGVRWHDGSALSAHDVCDTYKLYWLRYGAQHAANPTTLASTAGWSQVLDCKEQGGSAVVDFSSQYGAYLSLGSGVYGIVPATVLDPAFAHGAALGAQQVTFDLRSGSGNAAAFNGQGTLDTVLDGTGPFAMQSYTPGSQLVLVKNNSYWNTQSAPHLDKLVFKVEPDLASEVRDVESGAIQVGFDMRLANLQALLAASSARGGAFTVSAVPGSGAEKIDFNLCAANGGLCDNQALSLNPYTADPTIRKAMLEGIDRGAIVNAVASGRTTVPKDSWMYLGAAYLDDPSIPRTDFDRSAAERLLDNAGDVRDPRCGAAPGGKAFRRWKDGSCIVVNLGTTSDDAERVRVEAMVQSDLQAIGLNVPSPFKPNLPARSFFDTFNSGGPLYTHAFDTAMYTLSLNAPGEPDTYYANYHADCGGQCPAQNEIPSSANSGRGTNDTGVSDPQLDADLDKGRSTADLAMRQRFYVQAEQRLAAILPEIPLFQQVIVGAQSSRLQQVQQNDLVWDFNTADWYCIAGSNGKGNCSG